MAGNRQIKQFKEQPMRFTVCPANAVSTSGTIDFIDGVFLHTCSCVKGYMGHKGSVCQACQQGKYTSIQGSTSCLECAVGKHCSCSTSGNCAGGGELPACVSCTTCPTGSYQPLEGQASCEDCPEGFNCGAEGLTYPVAYNGKYVDPTDPKKTSVCTLGKTKAGDKAKQ